MYSYNDVGLYLFRSSALQSLNFFLQGINYFPTSLSRRLRLFLHSLAIPFLVNYFVYSSLDGFLLSRFL